LYSEYLFIKRDPAGELSGCFVNLRHNRVQKLRTRQKKDGVGLIPVSFVIMQWRILYPKQFESEDSISQEAQVEHDAAANVQDVPGAIRVSASNPEPAGTGAVPAPGSNN